MKIAITGHRGFIGRHTVRLLVSRGHRVVGFDRDRGGTPLPGMEEEYLEPLNGKFIHRIRSFRPDAILHLAGFPSIPACQMDPEASWEDNVHSTERVSLVSQMVPVVVMASTSAVGKWSPFLPTQCVYARDKMLSEYLMFRSLDLLKDASRATRIALRYYNVYGPGSKGGVIHHWQEAIRKKQLPRLNGTGEQTRDFIHVYDVARANCLALENREMKGAFFCDIGTGESIAMRDLLPLMGVKNFVQGPAFPGEILESCANTDPAYQYFNFRSEIDLKTGLAN